MQSFKQFIEESVGGKLIGKVGDFKIHYNAGKDSYHVQNTKNPESSFPVTHSDFNTDKIEMPRRGDEETLKDKVSGEMYDHIYNQVKDPGTPKDINHKITETIHKHLEPVIADHADQIADAHDYEETLRRLPR